MQPYQNSILGDSIFNSKYFNPDYLYPHLFSTIHTIYDYAFGAKAGTFKLILSAFCVFFFCVMAYCAVRLLEIRRKEHHHLEHEIAEFAHHQAEREKKLWGEASQKNARWVKILQDLYSGNPSDWKLAIIEADSMLDILMTDLGFKGESLGEKLKTADRDKFRNLTSAWEAHTIRNRIAHDGNEYEVSQHEAKRVIALYEQIFREFGYI